MAETSRIHTPTTPGTSSPFGGDSGPLYNEVSPKIVSCSPAKDGAKWRAWSRVQQQVCHVYSTDYSSITSLSSTCDMVLTFI